MEGFGGIQKLRHLHFLTRWHNKSSKKFLKLNNAKPIEMSFSRYATRKTPPKEKTLRDPQ
jgi:hypothetical protein